ncbi:MAG TPA: hypothetical protein VNS22_20335 [Geminicoccus sp.]|uniref:hypothetical protein n=1 Tax=Geminicoccus sp. TaxID=2024832 RepID=UPI002BC7410F|nr:hypothetical protein [Geminicoccus sp.]HWL70706.1 hypothetical protein [Geminicoccus sp.]
MADIRLASSMAVVGSILTGLGAFWGMHGALATEGFATAWLIPIGAAIGLACLLATSWHYVLGMSQRAQGAMIPLVLLLGGIVTGLAILTSSWWLTSALGGGVALRHHHQTQFGALETALRDIQDQAGPDHSLLQEITTARNSLERLTADEAGIGTLSGQTGIGPVTRDLREMSAKLDELQKAVGAIIDSRDGRITQARTQLDRARRASLVGDEAEIARSLADAGKSAAEAAGLSLADQAAILHRTIDSDLVPVRRIVAQLRTAVREATDDSKVVEIPQYQSMTRAEAVLHHAQQVTSAWAVSIALECLIFAMLCVLVVRAQLDRMYPPQDGQGTPFEVTTLRRAA